MIGLGIKCGDFPLGCYARIAPKSGLACKSGLDVLGGVCDRNYTGEYKVIVVNLDKENAVLLTGGMKIAQLIVEKYSDVKVELVDSLEDTSRGEGGFGSTGSH